MDSFIKTVEQQKLLKKINALKPLFQKREPELDTLNSFPYDNFKDLKAIDYHTLTLPKEFGGQGLGLYDYILAQEAISEGCGSTGLSFGWHNGVVFEYAENKHWNDEAAHWLLQEISKGALINNAASEKNSGSPTRGGVPTTTARLSNDTLIINGEKTYTSTSPVVDYFLVTATNDEGTADIIVIPRTAEGVSIENSWDMLAMRGTASHTLVLNNVRVPKSSVLRKLVRNIPDRKGWMLHIPACYLGIASAARNYAVHFAANYIPSSLGKPIATAPTIHQLIGEMELELATARQLLYGTIERYESATQLETEVLNEAIDVTKVSVTKSAIAIVDNAMKIVGSRALQQSNPMHRYYLNVRAGLYNPPMEDVIRTRLANNSIKKATQID